MDIMGYTIDKNLLIEYSNKKNNKNLIVWYKGIITNLDCVASENNIKFKNVTKIIEHLYQKFNANFIKYLDGSFSIIIIDKLKNKIFLFNDKLGNEKIYYFKNKENFIFSNKLKKIVEQNSFKKQIDEQVLANYLGYMYIYEPYTIYKNTYIVEKGSYLVYDILNKKITKKKYYDLNKIYNFSKIAKKSENELIDDYNYIINNSISNIIKNKKQIGVFMSSGKDSTLLAKIASNYSANKINTYTLGFENNRDESNSAEQIAKYIGTSHHKIILKNKEVLNTIHKITKYYDEPFADPSVIPCIYMIENINDNNDIYLSGEGNDAIFMMNKMLKIYTITGRTKLFIKKVINVINGKRVYRNFSEMAQVNVINRFNYSDRIVRKKGIVFKLNNNCSKIRSSVLGDLCNTVSEKYRIKTGTLVSNLGVDYSTPFYSPSIIKKTFETDDSMIYRNKKGKYIYNKVLNKIIPDNYFITYKKNGFGVPIIEWVKKMMLDEIRIYSSSYFIHKQNLFNYDEVQKLINCFIEYPDYNKAIVLWNYYIFQLWYVDIYEK